MFVEVWTRIKEIMIIAQTTLLTDSDLILTLVEAPPRGAKEYEKFVGAIGMRPTALNQIPKPLGDANEKIVAMSFPLDVYSQPFKLDYDVRYLENMFTVTDTIVGEFDERRFLENSSGTPLRHLNPQTPVVLTGGSIIKEDFPGTPGNVAKLGDVRYHASFNVNVSYLWTCPSKSV